MLFEIHLLSELERGGSGCSRDDDDSIGIGHDDVGGIHGDTVADDRDIGAGEAVVCYRRGGNDAERVNRKPDLLQVGDVAHATVDHGSREISCAHGRAHQAAHSSDVGAVFHDHYVYRIGRATIDGRKHAVERVGIVVGLLLEEYRQGKTGEFRGEDRPHMVGHVHFATGELLEGVGNGGDFDVPKAVEQGSIVGHRRTDLTGTGYRGPDEGGNGRDQETAQDGCVSDPAKTGNTRRYNHRYSPAV